MTVMALNRSLLATLLITLTLVGVQVVQASPLHDHSAHVVDCGLCHFSGTDFTVESSPAPESAITPAHFHVPETISAPSGATAFSYQVRAPPAS